MRYLSQISNVLRSVIFAKRSQWVSISVEAIGRKPAAENYVSIHLSGARTNEPGREISS